MSSDMDILSALTKLRREGAARRFEAADSDDYPYFGFLPKDLGSARIDAETLTGVATPCYTNVSVSAQWTNTSKKSVTVSLTAANQVSFLCTDTFVVGLYGLGVKLLSVGLPGTTTWEFDFDAATVPADRYWFVMTNGARLLHFNKGVLGLVLDLVSTVTLLAGFAESPVSNTTMAANFEFMKNYVEASPRMQPLSQARAAGTLVADQLNESYIHSGDSLIVVRYDGLDPVIGWGEGFTAGHSTIALRDPKNNSLFVCESTADDAYWKTNGIQCHPYREWIELANAAQYNVLLAPLSPEKSAQFNVTAAWEFFYETQGLNYGYLNFLFSWIDTRKDNFPCLPPTFEYCLTPLVETIALAWDDLSGDVPSNVFRQAFNHRIGTVGLSVSQVLYEAGKTGVSFQDIYMRPEQDTWRYNTTRFGAPAVGRAMTCCVFVCHTWKHGGLFDAIDREVNCGEQTLWDVFSMNMFDANKMGANRPEVCQKADPTNQLCQLIGTHTFHAKPDFNTRQPYKLMGQNCTSLAPDYVRAAGC